jgi:hypothetical protein
LVQPSRAQLGAVDHFGQKVLSRGSSSGLENLKTGDFRYRPGLPGYELWVYRDSWGL